MTSCQICQSSSRYCMLPMPNPAFEGAAPKAAQPLNLDVGRKEHYHA